MKKVDNKSVKSFCSSSSSSSSTTDRPNDEHKQQQIKRLTWPCSCCFFKTFYKDFFHFLPRRQIDLIWGSSKRASATRTLALKQPDPLLKSSAWVYHFVKGSITVQLTSLFSCLQHSAALCVYASYTHFGWGSITVQLTSWFSCLESAAWCVFN